jgi:hypothetical protein
VIPAARILLAHVTGVGDAARTALAPGQRSATRAGDKWLDCAGVLSPSGAAESAARSKGTLREHHVGQHRAPAVTRVRAIPSSCAAFVAAASRLCPHFPRRRSMVRRGLRFESGRGLEIAANQSLLLPVWARGRLVMMEGVSQFLIAGISARLRHTPAREGTVREHQVRDAMADFSFSHSGPESSSVPFNEVTSRSTGSERSHLTPRLRDGRPDFGANAPSAFPGSGRISPHRGAQARLTATIRFGGSRPGPTDLARKSGGEG